MRAVSRRPLLVLLLLSAVAPAVAAGPAQTHFSAVSAADLVVLDYVFTGRDGASHRLGFGIPQAEISAARAGFRAQSPEELRRLASAEQRRLLESEIAALADAYPHAEIQLGGDWAITWRVLAGADAPSAQRRLFDRLMVEEVARLRAEHPGVQILVSAGAYEVRAVDQAALREVMHRLRLGEKQANQAVARLAEEQSAGLGRGASAIGDDLRVRIAAVAQAMGGFERAYYEERRYHLSEDRSLRPDYRRMAREAVEPLEPVVAALTAFTRARSTRQVIDRLLLFLQTIPYDRLEDRATDAGFSPPLVVLADNRGDCDSKSVTFAALAHRLYPELPIALVLVPGHALVALGVAPEGGIGP